MTRAHLASTSLPRPVIALALLCLLPLAGAAAPPADDKKDERDRIKLPQWRFVNLFAGVTDARGLDEAAAAKSIKQQLAAAADGKNLRAVADLFQQHPFAVVEKIAKNKQLTAGEADGLARMRRQMINEAMARTVEALDPGKTLTIGMLDSGNKNSGIASDVDQTVFVMPKDGAKKLGIDEAKVIEGFNKQFKQLFGVTPERLGIESLNGADFFPDWRQAHSTDKLGTGAHELGKEAAAFLAEGDRVVDEKRKNPEAYRSEGQLKSQAEGRGYEALQEHHQRVRDLNEAKDKIEELAKHPGLSEGERKARIAEVEAALLKQHATNYPAGSLAELERKFNKDSPWTEVGWDETGKVSTGQLEDPASKVLANRPEFHERFAFDGAWDNWLMYEHHPHNRRKYLLRSIAEGISLRRQLGGKPLSTFEYDKVYARGTADSKAELKNFVDDVYRDLPEEVRRQFGKAMDVAAKERLRHKGAKNPSTGADYTLKEVWSEYWPAVTEQERALYADMPREAFEKMLHERAVRQWEAVGREIMIENLARTVSAPAAMLKTPLSDKEFARVREKFPDATRAKLTKAISRQLYHGLHDLISIEHARELVAAPEQRKKLPPRQRDLVDRLMEKLGGPESELGREVVKIARLAAAKRVATEPGQRTFRGEVYGFLRDTLKETLAEKAEAWREVRERAQSIYDEYKAGRITSEYVARRFTIAAAERLTSARVEALHLLGFDVKNASLLIPEHGWPAVEVEYGAQKWSGKKLLGNLACGGNVDSALTVMLAYQEGGAEAAAWAAGFEMIMNVPAIAQANAIKELVVDHRPQGIIMMGSAMAIPVLGQAYLFINIGKTGVTLLGHFVLDPLHDDDADKLYQGFLDERSGFRGVVRSQRPSLLHFVPIRVIARAVEGPDGKKVSTVLWQQYSRAEADQVFGVVDPKQYDQLAASGALGGGEDWEAALAGVRTDLNAARGHFEAKRASMYHHFGEAIRARLAPQNLDPDDSEALPLIAEFFSGYIDQWVRAQGPFAEFGENELISRRFDDPALRARIAARAASDFVYSYRLIRGSVIEVTTIERNIDARVEQLRAEEVANEANGMIFALDEAWKLEPDMDVAHAVEQELERRKEEARVRAPRFHAWPRVVSVKGKAAGGKGEGDGAAEGAGGAAGALGEGSPTEIEFLISVLDGPEPTQLTPANRDYRSSVRYALEAVTRDEVEVTAYVQVIGAQTGEKIPPYVPAGYDNISATPDQELAIKLGRLARGGSLPQRVDVKVAYRLKDAAAHAQAVAAAAAAGSTAPPATAPGAPPTTPSAPAPKGRTTVDAGGTLFENWDAKKATPRCDTWAGKAVQLLAGQVWVCWEKAPLDRLYYSEIRVAGGAQKYDHLNEGPAPARDRFPDQVEASGHANVFVLPFDWPEGHVGRFTLSGTIYALPKDTADAGWKTAPGVEKFEFTEPFEIPDQRAATDADLVVKYYRKMTAAQIAACAQLAAADQERYTKYAASGGGTANVELYQPFDSAGADLWGRKWGDADPDTVSGISFELHVRWKDAPPNAVYFHDCLVRGGIPVFEEKSSGDLTPRDEFPPAPYKAGPGSNAFTVRLPTPLWRGGSFEVSGTLYALPKKSYSGETWRQVTPLATFPFAQRFALHNRCRYAEGTVRVGDDATVYVMMLLAYVQRGRRLAEVQAGGKKTYLLIDDNYYNGGYFPKKPSASHWVNVRLPYGADAATAAQVSFMDFGERVTMTVPLTPEAPPGDVAARRARIAENEQKSLAKIAGWMKAEEGNLDPLRREYFDLAGWFRTLDHGKWSEYARRGAEYDERYYRKDLATTREEYKQQIREILAGVGESLYWGAVEWGLAGEAEGAFAAAAAKIQGAGLPAGLANGRLHALYRQHAENVVKMSGDLERARALWKEAEEYRKGASGGVLFVGTGEPVCPYTIDASFRE